MTTETRRTNDPSGSEPGTEAGYVLAKAKGGNLRGGRVVLTKV